MKIEFYCKCGLQNYCLGDWTAHWKYGIVKGKYWFGRGLSKAPDWLKNYPKLRAIYFFLLTEIRFVR